MQQQYTNKINAARLTTGTTMYNKIPRKAKALPKLVRSKSTAFLLVVVPISPTIFAVHPAMPTEPLTQESPNPQQLLKVPSSLKLAQSQGDGMLALFCSKSGLQFLAEALRLTLQELAIQLLTSKIEPTKKSFKNCFIVFLRSICNERLRKRSLFVMLQY